MRSELYGHKLPTAEERLATYQKAAAERLVNLTPHAVTLVTDVGCIVVPPSGVVARCEEYTEPLCILKCGVPLVGMGYGPVEGLPDPVRGVRYIVSGLVRSQCPERDDLVSPVELVRDESGRVIGCRALATNDRDEWHE